MKLKEANDAANDEDYDEYEDEEPKPKKKKKKKKKKKRGYVRKGYFDLLDAAGKE